MSQTTTAFGDILDESENRMSNAGYRTPAELNTDAGPEFTSEQFQSMLERRHIKHSIKPKYDLNTIATLAAAIQNIKKALARRANSLGTEWLRELGATIKGYNSSYNESINIEPSCISEHGILALNSRPY